MKALLLNGSPRKGNIFAALGAIEEGLETINGLEVENIRLQEMNIAPCMGCDACKGNGGSCIIGDDGNDIIEKLYEADILIFGTPVYWWGMTAQLKLAIDRLYADSSVLKGKPIGLIVTGADALDSPQYRLIREQFQCMADYVGFTLAFSKSISAGNPGEVRSQPDLLREIRDLGKSL